MDLIIFFKSKNLYGWFIVIINIIHDDVLLQINCFGEEKENLCTRVFSSLGSSDETFQNPSKKDKPTFFK